MRRVSEMLSLNMAILSVLGAVLLGMGQQSAVLPLVVVLVAVVGVHFVDRKRVFHLNRHLANLAALVAVGVSLFDFSSTDRNLQLLAIANLLVYLQIIVLLQEKNTRIYWQLAMLSLLEVVVAAALNYSVIFGILLVIYLFVGLRTLSLFFVYREAERYAAPGQFSGGTSPSRADNQRLARRAASGEMFFYGSAGGDLADQATRKSLTRTVLHMGLGTLLVTALLFVFIPRSGDSPWKAEGQVGGRVVGFSENVELGTLGTAVNNPETVMRVQFVDHEGRAFKLTGSPLLRGTMVTRYSSGNHRWQQTAQKSEVGSIPRPPGGSTRLVQQRVTLEPMNERVAFGLFPVYSSDKNHVLKYDQVRQALVRPEATQNNQITYELWTSGIEDFRQAAFVPEWQRLGPRQLIELLSPRPSGGKDPFAGLRRTAAEIVAEAGVPDENPLLKAFALEEFLLSDGGFSYSLTEQQRDPTLDPIEDFVVNNRTGHCEYFASALTLMLRSQGIPARMVIGYKGGDWNALGSFYQVRQLHAHTWVEAFIPAKWLTDHGIAAGDERMTGAWLTLDPTADTMDETGQQSRGVVGGVLQAFDYLEMLWIAHVVGLSRQQQQRNIYDPLKQVADTASTRLLGEEEASGGGHGGILRTLALVFQWLRGNWFSWRGGLAAMIACLALLALWNIARLGYVLGRRWWHRIRGTQTAAQQRHVEFYQRFEKLLSRYGMSRSAAQTQREFARAAADTMDTAPHLEAAAPLPDSIVDAFYLVRFGGHTLDKRQVQTVEQALVDLQQLLSQRSDRPGGSQPPPAAPVNGGRQPGVSLQHAAGNGHDSRAGSEQPSAPPELEDREAGS